MIDLSRIRSLKTLEEHKKVINDFINNPNILQHYIENLDWDEGDYECDVEQAKELLEKIEHRMKSLGNHLSNEKKKKTGNEPVITGSKSEQTV